MPTFKQKRDYNNYYNNLMENYPHKVLRIQEDMDTPSEINWDYVALNACVDQGFSYEKAREFIETIGDELADAHHKELEKQLNIFKATQAHNHATFLLNEIVKKTSPWPHDLLVFKSDEWAALSIKVDRKAAVIVEWNKESVILRIDLKDAKYHRIYESGDLNDARCIESIKHISEVYSIDLEDLDTALRRFANFFSSHIADTQ